MFCCSWYVLPCGTFCRLERCTETVCCFDSAFSIEREFESAHTYRVMCCYCVCDLFELRSNLVWKTCHCQWWVYTPLNDSSRCVHFAWLLGGNDSARCVYFAYGFWAGKTARGVFTSYGFWAGNDSARCKYFTWLLGRQLNEQWNMKTETATHDRYMNG